MDRGSKIFLMLVAVAVALGLWINHAQAQGTGTLSGNPIGRSGADWTVISAPAAGSQGTATKAAGGAGVKHVADCISFAAGALAAPTATSLLVTVRDGATGAGTILWEARIVIPAAAGQHVLLGPMCDLDIVGTANTAMTLEWSAALAGEEQSVTLAGYDGN